VHAQVAVQKVRMEGEGSTATDAFIEASYDHMIRVAVSYASAGAYLHPPYLPPVRSYPLSRPFTMGVKGLWELV
jgi:hypothetical protein